MGEVSRAEWTTGMELGNDGDIMVQVTEAEYDKLQKAGILLAALQTAGVEAWDGFDIAVALFNKAIGAPIA